MILTYSRDSFMNDILAGIKKTTFREDPNNRWHKGRAIQHWRGSPRNVKKRPFQFAFGVCTDIEIAEIDPDMNRITLDGHPHTNKVVLNMIAWDDGFKDWEDMKLWFNKPWKGKRIHFINK